MPKVMYLPRGRETFYSGISVSWTKTAQRIDISGWYDSSVGIEGASMFLREFFDELGITAKDCARAFAKDQENRSLGG